MAAQPNVRAFEPGPKDDSYRSPPHNIEAEQALLGAILVNNEACDRVSSFLDPSHFFEAVHARIYEAAATLIRAGKLASPVTLKTYFERDETLKDIGGPVYLARLAAAATTIINAEEYGRSIYELAQPRKLLTFGTCVGKDSYYTPVGATLRVRVQQA